VNKPAPQHQKTPNIRYLAARLVYSVAFEGQSLNSVYSAASAKIDSQQAGLLQELSAGTLRWYVYLNGCVKPLLGKPLKTKDEDIFALILVGAYQLLFTEKPDYAAISETVEACRLLKKPWASKLVNGVLRELQRHAQEQQDKLAEWQTLSHPRWLNKRLSKAWGEERASAIMQANNQRPPMCLRVNQQYTSRDDYLAQLEALDIDATATAFASYGIRLNSRTHPSTLPGFTDGACSVQDEAAQLCAEILKPAAGDRVLDACAAPGGKTCHLLEFQPGIEELMAIDIDAARLERVEENLERLGLSAHVAAVDAADIDSWWDKQAFDCILLDAPCSGTGVIRRHPDIKLLRQSEDIDKLIAIQQQLIQQLWTTLKPGGRLLYATCSVLPVENALQIQHFLAENRDAQLLNIDAEWGIDVNYGRQLLPETDGPDGFFYALLRKSTSTESMPQ
jgi:16S rRNA (cytosine967-C5)-methyltransferase